MPLITWSPAYSVNVKEMDSQHQILIEFTNQLHAALLEGKGSAKVETTVDQMIDYTRRHFKEEETLLSQHSYPNYTKQKAQHDAFIQKALDFKKEINSGNRATSMAVCNYLKDWLTTHIANEDKQYGVFLNAKGIR